MRLKHSYQRRQGITFNTISNKKFVYVYSLLVTTLCILSHTIYLSTLGEMWKRVALAIMLMLPAGHRFVTSRDFNQCDIINIIIVNVILSIYYLFHSKFLSYTFSNVYLIVIILVIIEAVTANLFFIITKAKSEFTKLSAATCIVASDYTVILMITTLKIFVDIDWMNNIHLLILLLISFMLPALITYVITAISGKLYALS